jgi:hypothetical protein
VSRELTEYNGLLCWCDLAHVSSLTGVDVEPNDMAKAQGILSIVTDVWPDMLPDDLRAGDRRRLCDARAYQAPWVRGRADLFAEVLQSGVSQDGVSAQYLSEYSLYLAPLALVCLRRLSWNRDGIITKHPGGRYPDIDAVRDAVLRDEVEDPSAVVHYVPGRPFS